MNNKKRYGKLIFGINAFQYGIELCFSKAGIQAEVVRPDNALKFDVIFISLFFYGNIYELEYFLRVSGLKQRKKGKPLLICGGMQPTVTPELVAEMCDYVFIGEAEDCFTEIVKNIEAGKSLEGIAGMYWKGKKTIPEPVYVDKLTPFWLLHAAKDGGARLEIARGCKHKCKFCLLSNLKPYRELDFESIKKCVIDIKRKGATHTSLFAPERTEHSRWEDIQSLIISMKLRESGTDARLEHIHRIRHRNKVRFGLEGISYKLRAEVGKPFTEDFIIKKMREFTERQTNIAFFYIYFILDLPGETEEDWQEFYDFFCRLESEDWSRRITVGPVFNPLSPKPFTPYYKNVVVHPFRDYQKKCTNFLRKNDEHWGFRIVEANVWGSWERILDAIVHYAGARGYKVIESINTKYLKKNPPKKYKDILSRKLLQGMQEKHGIKPEDLYIEC